MPNTNIYGKQSLRVHFSGCRDSETFHYLAKNRIVPNYPPRFAVDKYTDKRGRGLTHLHEALQLQFIDCSGKQLTINTADISSLFHYFGLRVA